MGTRLPLWSSPRPCPHVPCVGGHPQPPARPHSSHPLCEAHPLPPRSPARRWALGEGRGWGGLVLAIPGAGDRAGDPSTAQPWALGPALPCFEVLSLSGSCFSWKGTGEGGKSQAVMGFPRLLGQALAGPGGCGTGTFAACSQPPERLPTTSLGKLLLVQAKHPVGAGSGVWMWALGLDQVLEVRMQCWGWNDARDAPHCFIPSLHSTSPCQQAGELWCPVLLQPGTSWWLYSPSQGFVANLVLQHS